jgi:hypothetical protein
MKRKLFKALTLTGVLAFSGAAFSASAGQHLRVTVPFSFMLAGQQFAPGDYKIEESNNGMILIQGAGHAAAVLTLPAAFSARPTTGLRFTSSQSREYLVGFEVEGETSRAIPVHPEQDRKLGIASR